MNLTTPVHPRTFLGTARWLALPAVPGAVEPLLTAAKRRPRPAPVSAPSPTPVSPPTERADALARPVLQA